jgi:xanthine dehydrogenase accessory factor
MKAELFERLLAARQARQPVAVVTRLDDGVQALVDAQSAHGDLVLSEAQCVETRQRLRGNRSGPLDSADGALFARCHTTAPRLVLIGAVHIAQALAPMAAIAGFEVVVVDPRRAFATAERLPGVSVSTAWPDEALTALAIDAQTAVVALSHDPKLDDPAFTVALRSPAFYIGALGSKRTHAKRVERLSEAGLGDAIARIHAPVGLDLGGRSPAEIAVSILAQIIQVRYADPTAGAAS